MEILENLNRLKQRKEEFVWEGPFSEYLKLVLENPQLARKAHNRVYDMITAEGWEATARGKNWLFFSQELFGLEETLSVLVEEYLKPAAFNLDVKNRILVLMGPVGTGKSTIVSLIKRGLERYSRTSAGVLYGIKDCPMHEEPLHLIPSELREELRQRGIQVEGSLCPSCRVMLEQKYGGNAAEVLVERIFISEEDRVGIGTFVPSDPKSQDIAELTGSIDFSTIAEYGTESDPRAYKFDGELNKANRGLMEFQELFKCDEKFLYNLLSLAQEGNFKAGRFALISADELVIGHTNRVEYEEFIREGRNEALASRLYVVPVPYNLRLSEEERIYKKLLVGGGLSNIHLAPYALRTAAVFSILTRLREPCKQGISLLKKLQLYDGCLEGGFTEKDVEELRREAPCEGMEGVDPRFVLNCICSALANTDKGCVTSREILHCLKKGLRTHPSIAPGDVSRLETLLFLTENEHRAFVKKDVARACVEAYPGTAQKVFAEYMESVSLSVEWPASEVGHPSADVELMDFIESNLQVTGAGKKSFREELYDRSLKFAASGRAFEYAVHCGLKEAVEAEVLRRILHKRSPMQEALLEQALIKVFGYCPVCAQEALAEIDSLLFH